MLNPNQVKIFLTNIEDFIFTRGMFYSRKTYPGLEDYANNLEETIIGKLLITKEDFDKFKHKSKDFFTNTQKEFLWEQAGVIRRPPIYYKIMGLGHYSAYNSTSKTYLFQECETSEDWRNYLKNFERRLGRLRDDRQRKETGKMSELGVWNNIECCLNDARRAGNFDLEYQKWEPAIKAWEQRNSTSFYSDWNWEDLLGKEGVIYQGIFTGTNSSVSANPNLNNQSPHIPRFTNYDNNPRSKSRQSNSTIINSNSPLPQPHNYQSTVYPPVKPPKMNKSDYSGGVGIFGVILVFLLVALAIVILTKRKKE